MEDLTIKVIIIIIIIIITFDSRVLQFGVRILKKTQTSWRKYNVGHPNVPLEILGKIMPYEERLKLLKWPTLEQRRLSLSLIECYKTIYRLNGLHPVAFFTFAHDFRPLRANHRSNSLPKDIAEAENLNLNKNRLRCHLGNSFSEY